jgi:hypothetical protein
MLSGVYTILQKNPDPLDLVSYTGLGLLFLHTNYPKNLELFGFSYQEISSTLSLVNRINLIDTAVGLFQYGCMKLRFQGEPQEFSTLGNILYVAAYVCATFAINCTFPSSSQNMPSIHDPDKIVMILGFFSLTDGIIRETTRRAWLSYLKNEEQRLDPNSLDLAQNIIRQATYLYSGEEKNTLLKRALTIHKNAARLPLLYEDSRKALNSLLRKECFDYV